MTSKNTTSAPVGFKTNLIDYLYVIVPLAVFSYGFANFAKNYADVTREREAGTAVPLPTKPIENRQDTFHLTPQ